MDCKYTEQEFFDKVATHLLTQRKKSLTRISPGGNGCAYRGDDGLSCAIGCVIPDEVYKNGMEGYDVIMLMDKYPEVLQYIPDESLARALQMVHDEAPVSSWKEKLRKVVKYHGLDSKILRIL
jgi:hypothetical protein